MWSPPPAAGFAWLLDEWDLEASDVTEVIRWAEREATGSPFEVFARWQETPADQARFIRLLGQAPDDGGATETVLFSADK